MVSARKPPAQRLRCALLAALLAREARANQQLASLPSISSLPKHRRWMCRCTLHSNTRRPRQGAGRAAGGADPARRAVGRVRVVAASARAHPAAYRALRRVGDPLQPPRGLPQQAVAAPPSLLLPLPMSLLYTPSVDNNCRNKRSPALLHRPPACAPRAPQDPRPALGIRQGGR